MASLASGDDSFLLLSKRGTCTMISACTHAHENTHARTHTHTSKSTEPSARSKGGLGSGITYLSNARDPRGHSHLYLTGVCAWACPMHLLHMRLIPGTPGGGASLLTSHSRYLLLVNILKDPRGTDRRTQNNRGWQNISLWGLHSQKFLSHIPKSS